MPPEQLIALIQPMAELWGVSSSSIFTLMTLLLIILITILVGRKHKEGGFVVFFIMLFFFTIIGFVDWIITLLTMIIVGALFYSMKGRGNNG